MKDFLNTLMISTACAMIVSGCAKQEQNDTAASESAAPERKARTVLAMPAQKRTFEDRLTVQGTLEAKNYANVSVKIDGVLEDVLVDEGDKVIKDETVLFVSDTRKALQNKQVAEQNLLVATENFHVAEANVAKAEAQCDKARKDSERYTKLFEKGNVTINEKEVYTTNFITAEAGLKLAKAQCMAAKAQVQQAKVSFEIASRDLDDCTIKAPISGVVTLRAKESGEYASKTTPVLRIENTEVLEASAFIPGIHFTEVIPGTTPVRIVAEKHDAGELPVSFRADTIDTKLRTFEIKAKMDNDSGKFAPGMMADVTLVMTRRSNSGVPTHSIIEREHGCIVFMLTPENTAKELVVKTGLSNEGYTEILSCQAKDDKGVLSDVVLTEDTLIITEGQYLLVDKDPVILKK